ELTNLYKLPDSIENLLSTTCYDCHSNNTDYPFVINIQPFGWYMESKVTKGKKHLNFSEFGNYKKEEAIEKLEDIDLAMQNNRMPLQAYRWYNSESNLTEEQRATISAWAKQLKEIIKKDTAYSTALTSTTKP
ncbi:MAG TPA: heme-binding domain-containing protein, partial [Chitinophagaceae bacterium]|nr:heme-binding domain-containing protein [Chitinophagaceae bacterium]